MPPAAAFEGLAVTFAVVMLGATMPTPMYALYQRELGFSPVVQTVVFAVYALGVLAALLLAGRWSDQLGRRPMLLAGVAFSLVSSLVFLLAGPVWVLLVGRLLSGVSAGIFAGAATAAVIEAAPESWRDRGPAVATAANIGGLGLGTALAGVAVEYLPAPLHLSFAVHAVVVALCGLLVLAAPETVRDRPAHPSLRPQTVEVPPAVRAVFALAATAGFAGFAVLGLFTALSPRIVSEIVGIPNHAVAGVMSFVLLGASVVAQLLVRHAGTDRMLDAGCVLLVAGVGLVALSVARASMTELLAGAVIAGAGQGMTFSKGLAAVNSRVDVARRAGTTSSYFLVLYVAISLPVVGLGAASQAWGLRTAGIAFCGLVALLAVIALGALLVLQRREARPPATP
ncbi:MFS transporter [Pseudonocardia sp. Ae150A_Ps1]|uniref:MFS transporter n=1 Tax=Pseudonocardia sp. Ae150A_Ps1 TaxID=1885028 RepID=UPI0024B39973|nr:MFS transporter [Pseudonocardia sp. Ae150A_Ps1]